MAANHPPHQEGIILYPFILLIVSSVHQFSCQANNNNSPQNNQVFDSFPLTPPAPPPISTNNPPVSAPPTPIKTPQSPPTLPTTSPPSSNKKIGAAIGITAATTLVLLGLFFFFIQRCSRRRKEEKTRHSPYAPSPKFSQDDFTRFNGNLKGVIVDEDGLDVIYWRNLEGGDGNNEKRFERQVFTNNLRERAKEEKEEEKRIVSQKKQQEQPSPEIPLLRGESSNSQSPLWNDVEVPNQSNASNNSYAIGKQKSFIQLRKQDSYVLLAKQNSEIQLGKQNSSNQLGKQNPSNQLPKQDSSIQLGKHNSLIQQGKQSQTAPTPAPPPPPPPPPPTISFRKNPPPPPAILPKAKTVVLGSPLQPPLIPKGLANDGKKKQLLSTGEGEGQVKLKPLHWDKVNRNADHSMVWDKLDNGSFKVDDDLMEALFGYVATNRKSPRRDISSSTTKLDNKPGTSSQIFILDMRKSQNTAIVVKSLGVSRQEIIDALIHGEDLNTETLEKLTRIAPTKEEESQILAFDGDPARLADAESFLFHLLKSVPSAFTRFNAMLFRSNFKMETPQLKESLKILELGCKELRARGLLLKLLEAILKAGNRMNAGTSRGNAQAFNLVALRKLSDMKSTDGKTTLLHFVVEEVARAEGKRCVLNRESTLSRSTNQSSRENSQTSEEREKEYIMLGLPIVGGLSVEFSNVKKAASIDYDGLVKVIAGLKSKVAEIRKLVQQSGSEKGGFVEEMRAFLNVAEEEIGIMEEEQIRVMELVKRTTEYFQSGASQDKGWRPLQIFAIVKDFLEMVDKACVDIARNIQKRKPPAASSNEKSASSSPESPKTRPPVKLPKLPADFMSSEISFNDSFG